jgi:hypothetical protein
MRKDMICGIIGALVVSTSAIALPKTTTYCDPGCNLKYCTWTCCHITIDGGIATNISCFSDSCCAHPKASAADNATHIKQYILRAIRSSQ